MDGGTHTHREVAVGVDEEVGRLQVPVQDVGGVQVLEAAQHLYIYVYVCWGVFLMGEGAISWLVDWVGGGRLGGLADYVYPG